MNQMPTYDVIQHSLNAMGHSAPRAEHMRKLAQIMQHPNMRVHQFGNSVFMVLEIQPHVGVLSMHNADAPRELVRSTIEAMHWMKHTLHLRAVVFQSDNPAIHTLAQMMVRHAGIPGMRLTPGPRGQHVLYLGD